MHRCRTLPAALLLATAPFILQAYEFGPGPGYSGVPNESGTCATGGCHTGTTNDPAHRGSVTIAFPGGPTYAPGVKQHLAVTIADPASTQRAWGFQLTARLASDAAAMAGTFAFTDANTLLMCSRSDLLVIQEQCKNGSADRCVNTSTACPSNMPLQYMEHSLTGYNSTRGKSGSATYEFDWTPPAAAQGNITFYVSANAANADIGVSGDHIYNTKFTLAPQSGISLDNVVSASAFGGYSAIAPGSWMELYGTGLSGTTRQWGGGDFIGTKAPTSLDNVKVTIGGQNAFVYYISPAQINAQAPSNLPVGSLAVIVTNGSASTSPRNISVNALQPGLLAPASFVVGGKQYVAAQFADSSFVLPPGAIPGLATRQAKPGDTIVIYGVGFGPVQDAGGQDIPAGTVVTAANKLARAFSVTIGGQPAALAYQGLAPNFVGLYQFNVMVPDIADNDFAPLTYVLDGVAGPQTLFLAVKR